MNKIMILGSGVVGLAVGRGFLEHGHDVLFVDIDKKRVDDLVLKGYQALLVSEKPPFAPEMYFICTPTPATVGGPDITSVEQAVRSIAPMLKKGGYALIVTCSTVPVGTSVRISRMMGELCPTLAPGEDFDVCSNPEYLRERVSFADVENPRMFVLGTTSERAAQKLIALYKPFHAPIYSLKPNESEMHKYVHNLYNASKISFFNEQRAACDRLSIDADVLFPLVVLSAEASWNPSYGIRNLGPFGGACLPKDTRGFLEWMRTTHNFNMPLLQSIVEVNEEQSRQSST